ncbi:hypothetical protein IPC1241_19325 [Pseudomonas aeruginosa]|uniref:hypothetical protein n=1 Tax=Pseudomonas aeruginosa TaxID=287 RepID=UPI00037AC268|nr:hypothetical protein [Pseudomonas aeruginosa]AOX32991.1 hypothetical protein PA8281_05730 [Pseudomonas aeruginosa]APB57075.1 hypothetical protein PA7790_05792 [Pseudomonas aeruginosa]ARU38949.1 hypothetical protein AL347_31595 [Pseudomonas aeruginosa]KSJ55017.1 hypothetical protein APA05_05200 [Pseudomonas aeruginosa]KSM09964.1 hypothetical protein APA61_29420 [Pseudomonas aeruginosa]
MKTVVHYDFVGPTVQFIGLTPRTLMTREYASRAEAFIPVVGEKIMVQWGPDKAQSNTFIVENISNTLWEDSDVISVSVKHLG